MADPRDIPKGWKPIKNDVLRKGVLEKKIEVELDGERFNVAVNYRHTGIIDSLILFLHGLGCDMNYFQHVWVQPDPIDSHQILTLDLPGHGNTNYYGRKRDYNPAADPEEREWRREILDPKYLDLEFQARFVYEVLLKIKEQFPEIKDINIVGHSMGGSIGILLSKLINEKKGVFRLGNSINIEGNLFPAMCFFSGLVAAYAQKVGIENFNHDQLKTEIYHLMDDSRKQDVISSWMQYVESLQEAVSPQDFTYCCESLWKWSHPKNSRVSFGIRAHEPYDGQLYHILYKLAGSNRGPMHEAMFYYIAGAKSDSGVTGVLNQKLYGRHFVGNVIPKAWHFVMSDAPQMFYPELRAIFEYSSKK